MKDQIVLFKKEQRPHTAQSEQKKGVSNRSGPAKKPVPVSVQISV